MSLGLNHATYGPDIKLQYANPLATHNPKNFGSNQGIVRGFTGPINSQQSASSFHKKEQLPYQSRLHKRVVFWRVYS